MVGAAVQVDSNGYLIGVFNSPDQFNEPAKWLKEMIAFEDKTVNIMLTDECGLAGSAGAGSFKNGIVKIDRDCITKNSNGECKYGGGYSPIGYFSGPDNLAHELLGHGYDWMFNNMPGDPSGMGEEKKKWERRARDREKLIRGILSN